MEEKAKYKTPDVRFWSDFNKALINVPHDSSTPCILLKSVKIDSQEMIDKIVNLVFAKAISNPDSITSYGIVCKNLAGKYCSTVNFLKSIIARCLSELENCSRNENLRATKAKENEKRKDNKKKKELQALYEEERRSIRMKSVGIIWLLKEMWLQKILKKKIMHSCIDYFLQHGDEENLEFLYKLLMEIGENLELNADLEKYYKLIQIRINDQGPEKISSRVREMLQELIALRANWWVSKDVLKNFDTQPQLVNLPEVAILKKKKEKKAHGEIPCILNRYDLQNVDTGASEIKPLPIEDENLQEVTNILLENPKVAKLKKKKKTKSHSYEKNLYVEIRRILNRYDSQNIDTVARKIKSLPIKGENWQEFTNILFEKACNDLDFVAPCVLLCKKLSSMEVPGTSVKNETWNDYFQLFVFDCVYEFEQCLEKAKNHKWEEYNRKETMKSAAFTSLFGKLFCEGVLSHVMVDVFIKSILEYKTEENLGLLCLLLSNIQYKLDHFENMPTYVDDLQQIVAEKASGRFSDDCYEALESILELMDLLLTPEQLYMSIVATFFSRMSPGSHAQR